MSELTAKSNEAGFDVVTSENKVTLLTASEPGTYYIAVPAGVQITIYNGDTKFKATKAAGLKAGMYYTLTTGPVSGKAKATINGETPDVDWVQLWAGGPKFAKQNVTGTMTWTAANANNFWGTNWRVPTKEEMSGLLGTVAGDITFTTSTVKVEYLQENNEFGFKFTGVQPGYTKNSIFLALVNANYWTSYQDNESKFCYCLSLFYNEMPYLHTFIFTKAHADNEKYAVRPVLK